MSSTKDRVRDGLDFYQTPRWCVDRLVNSGVLAAELATPGLNVLEPAAGRGAIVERLDGWAKVPGSWVWTSYEIDLGHIEALQQCHVGTHEVYGKDFLGVAPALQPGSFQVIITNPPYSLSHEYLQACWRLQPKKLIFLLRLSFLASANRTDFMRKYAPDVYVLPDRPSFTGKGADSTDYAWFCWYPRTGRKQGLIEVLPATPLAERKAK